MFGTQNLGLFITAGLLLNMTPGPDTFYILGRSIGQGRAAGIASALGISTGCLVHTIAVALGLSALLLKWPVLFQVIRFAGAAYLVYLGCRLVLTKASTARGPLLEPQDSWAIYRQAILTNVLNPKVALFFLAFLPQFVAPTAQSTAATLVFLGLVFIFNGTLWCLALALFASTLNRVLQRNAGAGTWMNRGLGVLLLGLGVRLGIGR